MKLTKKFFTILIALTTAAGCLSLCACGNNESASAQTTAAETSAVSETSSENTEANESTAETAQAETSASIDDCIGYTYGGKDPWGADLSVTLRELKDGKLVWTFTDSIDETHMIYQEITTEVKDDSGEWNIEGVCGDDSEDMKYKYSGTISIHDGKVEITFTDGQLTSISENGGGGSHMAGALSENDRTVVLEKDIDPDTMETAESTT